MAFHFSLQSLLRYRRSKEREREVAWQRASAEVLRIEAQVHDVDLEMARLCQCRAELLPSGMHASELQWYEFQRSAFRARRQWLEKNLQEAARQREACRQHFLLAKQQRETVEKLRDLQREAYRIESERTEQQQLDDLYLLHRFHLANYLPRK